MPSDVELSQVRPGRVSVSATEIVVALPDSNPSEMPDVVLDVEIAGHRVWSFRLPRDGTKNDLAFVVHWPQQLAERLSGHAQVRVLSHADRKLWFDQEVDFDGSAQPLRIVDGAGHPLALDKDGRLRRLFTDVSADAIQGLLDAIVSVLDMLRAEGVTAFPAYGTLLGAVRDGQLIGHDHDADVTYLTEHTHPVPAMLESFRLERAMRAAGHSTQRHSAFSFMVDVEEAGVRRGLDVFGAMIMNDTLVHLSMVVAPMRRDQILPLGSCTLNGVELPAPADPDAWLTAAYVPTWRTPDPAFKFEPTLHTRRRLTGWFRGTKRNRPQWDDHYLSATRGSLLNPTSQFATWVLGQATAGTTLVDLGCGWGHDVVAYARAGHQAIGLDYSRPAFARAAALARRAGLSAEFATFNVNDLRSVLATGTSLVAGGRRLIVAVHLFAEALSTEGRDGLWRICAMVGRTGGQTFLGTIAENSRRRSIRFWPRYQRVRFIARLLGSGGLCAGSRVRSLGSTGGLFNGLSNDPRSETNIRGEGLKMSAEDRPMDAEKLYEAVRAIPRLRARIVALEQEMQETRQLNRRLAELVDVVSELLVPLAQGDPAAAAALAEQYRRSVAQEDVDTHPRSGLSAVELVDLLSDLEFCRL